MRYFLAVILFASALAGQTSNYPGSLDTDAQLFVSKDNIQTTLTSAMAAGDSTAIVKSTTGWLANMIAYICDSSPTTTAGACPSTFEEMLVTNVNGNVLTVTRGIGGTSAIAHASGRNVTNAITASYHTSMAAAMKAVQKNTITAVTAESYGCAGDGTTDDTVCVQAALTAIQGTTKTLLMNGKYKVNGCPTATAAVSISGSGTILVSPGAGVTGCGIAVTGTGATATKTTTATNLALNQRSLVNNQTIAFAATAGFSAGDTVDLGYDDATYHFEQINVIQSISAPNVTFVDPIVVPLLTTQPNNITRMSMIDGSSIKGLTFDCSGASASASEVIGIHLYEANNSLLQDLNFLNCSSPGTDSAAGVYAYQGWRNSFIRLHAYNSGSLNHNAIDMTVQSHWSTLDLEASRGPSETGLGAGHGAFGIGFNYAVLGTAANTHASGNYSRQVKLLGAGYNTLTNTVANDSIHATGLAVTIGSFRNKFFGVTTLHNTSDVGNGNGIWLDGQDNEYNLFYGTTSQSNGTADISWTSTDINNTWYGTVATILPSGAGAAQTDSGSGNRVEFVGDAQFGGSVACSGVASAGATLILNQTPSGACTSVANTQGAYFTVPTSGWIRNLQVTAGAGGVNASSGLVAITIVGGGSTGVTATFGTSTSKSDLTHSYHVAAGQQFYVSITTQGGETLANINVSFEY